MSRPKAGEVEQRTTGGCQLRAESQGDEMALVGYAAMYNSLSKDLGGFREQIMPGAFKRSIDAGDDVKALFNHNPNAVLGRVKNNTLTFMPSGRGLKFRVQLDPFQQSHRDLHAAIKRGDIDSCSFAFTVPQGGDSWEHKADGSSVRTLKDVDLMDVSAVTYPAYNDTAVAARSLPDYSVATVPTADELRAKAARLGAQIATVSKPPLTDSERRAKAARLGAELRGNEDWYSMRHTDKEQMLDQLQGLLDDEYGEDCYRAIDCTPGEPNPNSGYVIARDLNSEDEAFQAFDWDLDEDDADERQLKAVEVSSLRGLKLCSRGRKVTASGTVWSHSVRALRAAAAWVVRNQHLDNEMRMAVAAGNQDAISRLSRLRGRS